MRTGLHKVPVLFTFHSWILLCQKTWIFLCPIWYKLMWNRVYLLHVDHSRATTTTYDVVFGVPEPPPPPHKMLSLGYVEFTSWIGFYRWLTPPSHFGDRTHATYSCGLDCEKQEHWNRARKSLHSVSCWTKITHCEATGNLISASYQAST